MFSGPVIAYKNTSAALKGIFAIAATILLAVAANLITPYVTLIPTLGFWGALIIFSAVTALVVVLYEISFRQQSKRLAEAELEVSRMRRPDKMTFSVDFSSGQIKGACEFLANICPPPFLPRVKHIPLSALRGYVLFVSKPRDISNIQETLSFRILSEIERVEDQQARYVWLLCGDFDKKQELSLELARQLKTRFSTGSSLTVHLKHISNLDDPKDVYERLAEVFAETQRLQLSPVDVVADCTSGVRWIYAWFAVSSIRGARLCTMSDSPSAGYTEIPMDSLLTWERESSIENT